MTSTNRIKPEAGFINIKHKKHPRGQNGRLICRCGCGQEVQPPRRTFFSDNCVHEWKLRSNPGYLREMVFQRDRAICANCRRDCNALLKALKELGRTDRKAYRAEIAALNQQGFIVDEYHLTAGQLWQADHIVPVAEGGGECGLNNLRTLCTPCHKRATAALRKRLAVQRKQTKTNQLSLLEGNV